MLHRHLTRRTINNISTLIDRALEQATRQPNQEKDMAGLCDECKCANVQMCKCANEDQTRMKLLEKVVKAQSRLLVAYRIGGKPPEWVLDTLAKAKKAGIDCQRQTSVVPATER